MRYIAVTASEERALEVQADWPGTIVTKVSIFTWTVSFPDPASDAVIEEVGQGVTSATAPSSATARPRVGQKPGRRDVYGAKNARRVA